MSRTALSFPVTRLPTLPLALAAVLALVGCGSSSPPAASTAPLANTADVTTHEPASTRQHSRAMEEGKRFLEVLGTNAKAAWARDGYLPTVTVPLTPATDCCTEGNDGDRRCTPNIAYWSATPWADLDFAVEQHHYFQYSYTSTDGKSFTATAVGDLDCDGHRITYTLTGQPVDGDYKIVLLEPDPNDD